MTNYKWKPTLEFRWNRRPDAASPTFWETTYLGGGKSRRPVGYRLEQKWTRFRQGVTCSTGQGWIDEEWRQIPFVEECLLAKPELDMKDKQFWPVASNKD